MALNQNDMTLQRMAISLNQLVEQMRLTQATKSDMGIEDIIKAMNLTFKTSRGDTTELKNLIKIAKSSPNASHYEKLTKMLELLLKSYDNPDLKQMKRLGISTQNLAAEIIALRDTIKASNIVGNEKANLSVLSKAVADGQRQYAISGFGRDASAFYKKATLEQLKLLRTIDKHIDEGIPLKDLNRTGLLDRIKGAGKKVGGSGILSAGADMVLKGMGFGELPGQFLDMFAKKGGKNAKDEEELTKKQELQSLKVQGIVGAKEKAQQSLMTNQTIQKRAEEVRLLAETTKSNLAIELSKAIAGAMETNGTIDSRFASDDEQGKVDITKIIKAIETNSFPKDEIESLVNSAYLTADGNEELNKEVASTLMKNLDEIQEYSKIVEEQDKVIADSAIGIQTAIESISTLFVDLRDILGKELTNELKELNRLFDRSPEFRGLDEETRNSIKQERIDRKLAMMASTTGVAEDELQGLIGGESSSKYMEEYKRQGEREKYGTGKTMSEIVREAFEENTFRDALGNTDRAKPLTPGEEFENRVRETTTRLKRVPVPVPHDLSTPSEIEDVPDNNVNVAVEGISMEDITEIVAESITDFLKSFEEAMKTRDKESKDGMEVLKKALLSGEMKVNVVNLRDIPQSRGGTSGGGGGERGSSNNTRYGE